MRRILIAVALTAELLVTARASAQVISSAADNDMEPTFSDDGWVVSEGAFRVVSRQNTPPSMHPGMGSLRYSESPDGNTYAGATTVGTNVLSKEILGVTPGTAYVVEWYLNGYRADWEYTYLASTYFAVTLCGTTQESERVPWYEEGVWRAQSLVFVADAPSCTLSFRALGEAGGGSSGIGGNTNNYAMLDGVQLSATTLSDFGLSVAGPTTAGESPTTVSITVDNSGPAEGAPPVVTYRGGGSPVTSGPLAVSGPDAASWSCATVPPNDSWIACTRAAPLPVGSSETFAFDVVFGVGSHPLTSRIKVAPTLYEGNADPNPANDQVAFDTQPPPPVCGNGRVDPGENCDDGNVIPGDGCGATCASEPGYQCFYEGSPCVDIDECAEDSASCFADLQCTNTPGGWTCGCEPGSPDCNSPPTCRARALNGQEACPFGYECRNTADAYVCICDPRFAADCPTVVCGDGQLTGYETCDDGNTVDGDGCDHNCRAQLDWVCVGQPSTCVYRPRGCTNRIVDFNETCDDGGLANDDGCDQTCQIEPGWTCSGEPSVCTHVPDDGGAGMSGGDSTPPACPPPLTLNSRTRQCVPRLLRGCSATSASDAAGSLWLLALALVGLRASRRRR